MFWGYKAYDTREYSSSLGGRGVPISLLYSDRMSLTPFQLSLAMARTILVQPGWAATAYQAGSSLLFLKYALSRGENLRLKTGARHMFRDFSRTSRIGEMAQGVSWLISQWIGFPICIDFRTYVESQGLPEPRGDDSTPDFVLFDPLYSSVFVMEVKGSWPHEQDLSGLKAKFKKALAQCDKGDEYFTSVAHRPSPIVGKYGLVVEFAEESDAWQTTVNLADPDQETSGVVESPLALLRRHYVSWFLLLGLYEYAAKLLRNESLGVSPSASLSFENEVFYIMNHSRSQFTGLFYAEPGATYTFAMSTKVWEVLNGDLEIRRFQYYQLKVNLSTDNKTQEYLFADGTLVIITASVLSNVTDIFFAPTELPTILND